MGPQAEPGDGPQQPADVEPCCAQHRMLWRVNLRESRATIRMRSVSRRDDHAGVLFVAVVFYVGAWSSPGLGTPTFFGVA